MARTSNKTAPVDETNQVQDPEVIEQANASNEPELVNEENVQKTNEKKPGKEIPADVLALMKLYPQYEEFYVTPKGFVHPAGVPEYLRKDATLYKNKFFNK